MDMPLNEVFDFGDVVQSHMPYVANAPDGSFIAVCCLKLNGLWKVHLFDDGIWRRVETTLPEDATECSPMVEYNYSSNKWHLSFIGGGYAERPMFYLYDIEDICADIPNVTRITSAEAGFVWKNRVAYCGRQGAIFVSHSNFIRQIEIDGLEYTYRVTNNVANPNELIVSGQRGGELFTWLLNPEARTLRRLLVDGQTPYKACLFGGKCIFALKSGDGFEDRKIVVSDDFTVDEMSFDGNVSLETLDGSIYDEDFE